MLIIVYYYLLGCGDLGTDETFSEVLLNGNEYSFYIDNDIMAILNEYPDFLPDYFEWIGKEEDIYLIYTYFRIVMLEGEC